MFERSAERPHSGRCAAKMVCRSGDVYARWVYRAPDLFATVKRGDRLKLSFWYRASAALGDALVMISQDAPPGYAQYPLTPLKATGNAWVRYEAVFTVADHPTGGGEVQLRGTTDRTGDQEVSFDDVSLVVVGNEQPRRDVVVLGDAALGLTGVYHPDGRITFDDRPIKEWEFMATGTGVSGLTVSFPDEMVMQVNHSASIDESGQLRALARLHLDLGGRPFATATNFRMEHDLRRSVIRAFAQTSNGLVRVEIRAHVPDDIIRLDIIDERKTPEPLTMRLEEDAPSSVTVASDGSVRLWHENPAGTVAPIKRESPARAAEVQANNRPWLAGRTFGLAIGVNGAVPAVAERTLTLPAAARHSLLLAGVSTLRGRDAFTAAAAGRLRQALGDGPEGFVAAHETWWRDFWARASFEPDDKDGSLLRQKAAFDLYRYYLACCAGERRETPVRFQIDLFRYHLRYNSWMTGLICAVEQYQSFYVLPWSQGKSFYQLNAQQTELYAVWPAKLVLRGETDRDRALRSYRDRLFQHSFHAWDLDVVFAACLGLREEVAQWHDRHFSRTFVLPCGLARETAQNNPAAPSLPECPSLQGMGTGVLPVLEMLLQDYPDELVVLPCWPEDVAVDFTLYSPYAGRVEIHYRPGSTLRVATQREIRVRTGVGGPVTLQVKRLNPETDGLGKGK
ncbi:MAG: hypothetical protein FJ387_11855 [Verrucomicrobia bacterium]|nr:hypothetical protein [Verrucomicrobiota bacterium]